tara:strand:- start:163 stop:270 length:108 start_codon:yes stop_codon:yes gene_type:complete
MPFLSLLSGASKKWVSLREEGYGKAKYVLTFKKKA